MAFDGVFTHYLVNELNEQLSSGRINKIYQVSNYELVFLIRARNKTQKLLLSIHPVYSRAQITELDLTYPQEPPMFCMLLRKHLEGGIIQNIEQKDNDRIILFDIEYMNEIGIRDQKRLIVEIMGKHSNIILINRESNTILDCIKHVSPFLNSYRTLQPGAEYIYPPSGDKKNFFQATLEDFNTIHQDDRNLSKQLVHYFEGVSPLLANELLHVAEYHHPQSLYQGYEQLLKRLESGTPTIIEQPNKSNFYLMDLTHIEGERKYYSSLSELLDRFYFKKDEQERIKQQTQDLEKFIKNELDKNTNKLNHLETDLYNAEHADIYKVYGDLILTYAYQIQKGMTSIELENYYDDNQLITLQLDPLLTPIQNAQRYFNKYQKGKKAIHHIHEQIALTKQEIDYFETLLQQVQSASLTDALEIRSELEELRYLKRKNTKQKKKTKLAYETYQVEDASIFVGKNNLQNDYLTFKHANKEDTWMHAKDMPGSHVIIRCDGTLSEEVIRTGAMLASFYSKGRQSSSVPIDYTLVKNVKKIPGAKPGFVTYDHQKTIYIDPSEDFIHSLTVKK